ncbi:TBC domain-containing protein [Cryptosporidium canis]|uniref:TBC domain-containing protein n=1 Tax=Cryptosporidium canis TaxID=195482 RepID=A0A9D5DNE1_9CRYT|nr:TBC domain-containing protein [Cryptosporidium canis]
MSIKLPVLEFIVEKLVGSVSHALNEESVGYKSDSPDYYDHTVVFENFCWKRQFYIDIMPLEFRNLNISLPRTSDSKRIVGMGWVLENRLNTGAHKPMKCQLSRYKCLFPNIILRPGVDLGKWANYRGFTRERLMKLCANGIPREIRGEIWCYLLGSDRMLTNNLNVYFTELNRHIDKHVENQINLDLHRTFPNLRSYSISTGFNPIHTLNRVLSAFASHDKDIGYCQSMNFIVAILLMNMKEEAAFWSIVQLVSHNRNRELMYCSWGDLETYYCEGMDGIKRDILILESLCKKIIPDVSLKLETTGINFQWFALEWFLCFFVTSLPLESVMDILDFIFCFGSDMLFNVSIALLDLNRREILESNGLEECMVTLKNITRSVTDPLKIIRRAIKN